MANIMDYLDWRGDVPFSVSPFCEVDSLVFSQFCFIDLNGIVPSHPSEGGVPLGDAVARYFESYPDDQKRLGLIVPPQTRPLMRRMAESTRYRDVVIRGFVDHIDESIQKQFAAMTFEIDEQVLYVVFRGTDDTLVGWKENFNMSFLEAVPAQLDAVDYLNEVGRGLPHGRIYVGGHSKGGNLAIYSAIHCDEAIRSRIVRIYSNDGPGYRREVVESEEYRAMEERIVNIIPQTSVVGRLLEHGERYTVIQSTASVLWQHDGFSWEVKGTSFVAAPALTKESEMVDRSLKKWVAEMSEEQRRELVDALYRILTATNAKTLTELTGDRNWLWQLVSSSDPKSRKTLVSALTQLTGEAGRQWLEYMLPSVVRNRKDEETAVQETVATARSATKPKIKRHPKKEVEPKDAAKKDALTVMLELIAEENKKNAAAIADVARRISRKPSKAGKDGRAAKPKKKP